MPSYSQILLREAKKSKRSQDWDRYSRLVEKFVQTEKLDEPRNSADDSWIHGCRPSSKYRTDIVALGLANYFMRLYIDQNDRPRYIEKCVPVDDPEVAFWREYFSKNVSVPERRVRLNPPTFVGCFDSFALIVFPFLSKANAKPSALKSQYRSRVLDVASALGTFNRVNIASRRAHNSYLERTTWLRSPRVPNRSQLLAAFGTDIEHYGVERIQANIDDLRGAWPGIRAALRAGPWCISHQDAGPGNVLFAGKRTYLIDWDNVAIAPLGSDLHTCIRWATEGALDSGDGLGSLIEAYLGARGPDDDVNAEGVELAAWAHFCARYLNFDKWASARNFDSYRLAVKSIPRLIALSESHNVTGDC